MTNNELIAQTDAIRERYPHWWRDLQAQCELRALWGDAINDVGVLIHAEEETLYNQGNCRAVVRIATENGLFAYGCSYQSSVCGYGHAPDIWGEMFTTRDAARSAAIECLLSKLPKGDHNGTNQCRTIRDAIESILAQPTLF